MSIWHIIVTFIITAILIIPPFWMLFGKYNIPKILSIFAIIPFINILFLWILAYRKVEPLQIAINVQHTEVGATKTPPPSLP